MIKRQIAVEIICFLFIFLFAYAAVNKLMDVQKFQIQIGKSPILTNVAIPVSWFIPIIELVVTGLLMTSRFRLLGLLISFSLMVMFTGYIILIMNFSEHVPCSCGGVLQSLGWRDHLIFNLVFVSLSALGIILEFRRKEHHPTIKEILLQ